MNQKKLESEVMENSYALEIEIDKFIKTHKNKYVVYNKGMSFFVDTLKEGVQKGIDEFGEKTGFVVKKLTQNTPIFSSLIKL